MLLTQTIQGVCMSTVKFKGGSVTLSGKIPQKVNQAPEFLLTKNDLSDVSSKDFSGTKIVMNIFPSVDTGVCAASVRRFNQEAARLAGTKVLCISRDLPFAQARFCGAEGIDNVIMLSELRNRDFGKDYGLAMNDGPLAGLLARAVIVVDENRKVVYSQLVPEITEEPDYDAVIKFLNP